MMKKLFVICLVLCFVFSGCSPKDGTHKDDGVVYTME